MDEGTRDAVLTHMEAQGASKAVGFIGPFDAVLRSGATPAMSAAVDELIVSAAKRGTAHSPHSIHIQYSISIGSSYFYSQMLVTSGQVTT